MHTPVRQCISCRKKKSKSRLLRILREPGGRISFDEEQRGPGRGAYLCPDANCVKRARERGFLDRALGTRVPDDVFFRLADAIQEKNPSLDALLGFAARAGKLVLGTTALENAVRKGVIRIVLLDGEARATTRKRVEGLCAASGLPLIRKREGRPIADVVGKANCRCIGIRDASFAHSVSAACRNSTD